MKIHGSTELARMQMLQRQVIDTRAALDRAALETTTGRKADQVKATGGNLARLFSIERMLERNAVFQATISLTGMRLDVMQEGLGRALAWAEGVSVDLISATGRGEAAAAAVHAGTARRAFLDAVGMLNAQAAGQSLFAGTTTDRPALARGEAMLADLDALIAGAPDAATAAARVEDYFAAAPPGGFFTGGRYLGADQDLAAAEIGDGVRLDYALRADDPALRAILKGFAMAAVAVGPGFALPQGERMGLLAEAGRQLLDAKEGLLDLRARVGISQETVEAARAQRVAEFGTYDLARAKIVGADAFAAASTFQAMQSQLESIFTVTARIAGLRFVNFMR